MDHPIAPLASLPAHHVRRERRNTARSILRGAGISLPQLPSEHESISRSRTLTFNPPTTFHRRGASAPYASPTIDKPAWEDAQIFSTLTNHLGARATLKYRPIPNTIHSTTGYIDSVSAELHQVIVRERPNAGELRLIAIDRVLEFKVEEQPKPETMPAVVVPLTQKEIAARTDSTLAKEREQREHTGLGVDKAAQELYDAMRRLFPGCRWSGKSFVVNDTVLVEPPYGPENVKVVEGVKGAEKGLPYLKKALEGERKKIAEKTRQGG